MSDKDLKGYNLPPEDISPKKKKDKKYGLLWAKMIEANYSNKNNNYYQDRVARIKESRAYARGSQSVDRYKQLLNPSGDNSFANFDWSPLPVISKFRDTLVNDVLSQTININAEAKDPVSMSKRKEKRDELVGRLYNRDFLIKEKETSGLDLSYIDFIPEEMDEVNMYMSVNFKQSVEIAMTSIIRTVMELNNFDEIKRRVVQDLVDTGYGIARTYFDPSHGIVMKYVDIENFISSQSFSPSFDDIKYAGEIRYITLSEIRKLSEGDDSVDEETIANLAKNYAGRFGNESILSYNSTYDSFLGINTYQYDEFLVPVLDFEFKTLDSDKYETRETKYGYDLTNKVDYDYVPPKKSKYKRKISSLSKESVYGGTYVLSSSVIINYGMKSNLVRDKEDFTKTRLSYKVYSPSSYQMHTKSIVERMIPNADNLQLAWLKLQQSIAKSKPEGLKVDISGLEDVSLGNGQSLTPLRILDIYDQTGRIIYRSRNASGEFVQNPIQELPNPIRNIPELINIINANISMMRETTGMTPEREGQTKSKQLVGVTELSIESSRNSTRDINYSIENITRRLAEDICLRIQDIPEDSIYYSFYEKAISGATMSVVESMGDLPIHSFGITIEIDQNNEQKLAMERDIQTSLSTKEIRIEDASQARKIFSTMGADAANVYLNVKRKQNQKQMLQIRSQEAQMKAQQDQQSAMLAAQARQEEAQIKAQAKMMEIEAKAKTDIAVNREKAALESELSRQEFEQNLVLKELEITGQIKKEDKKEVSKDNRIKLQAKATEEVNKVKNGDKESVNTDNISLNEGIDSILKKYLK